MAFSDGLAGVRFLRSQADAARRMAEGLTDPAKRLGILEFAEGLDAKADKLEVHSGSPSSTLLHGSNGLSSSCKTAGEGRGRPPIAAVLR